MSEPNWPDAHRLAAKLLILAHNYGCSYDETDMCEVRLQVYPDGTPHLHWGPSDYDLDHNGYCGASYLPEPGDGDAALAIACDLLEQAQESYYSAL